MSAPDRRRQLLQRTVPAVVSVGALVALFSLLDPAAILAALSWRVAFVMVPALLVYGAVTLVLEAASMVLLVDTSSYVFRAWTAARIKCASYLVGIVHYALGVGALTLLLRRRAGVPLGEAASVVLLISFTDLTIVLCLAAVALAGLGTQVVDVPPGVLAAATLGVAALGFFGGVALLRAPFSLGPLENLRRLAVFAAVRDVALAQLAQLIAMRVVFTLSFIAVSGAAFVGFGLEPGFSRLVMGMMVVAAVSALPIAVAGLGTGQVTFLLMFRNLADEETLLAASLVLTAGMVLLRAGMGLVFAREFTQEALAASRAETA